MEGRCVIARASERCGSRSPKLEATARAPARRDRGEIDRKERFLIICSSQRALRLTLLAATRPSAPTDFTIRDMTRQTPVPIAVRDPSARCRGCRPPDARSARLATLLIRLSGPPGSLTRNFLPTRRPVESLAAHVELHATLARPGTAPQRREDPGHRRGPNVWLADDRAARFLDWISGRVSAAIL